MAKSELDDLLPEERRNLPTQATNKIDDPGNMAFQDMAQKIVSLAIRDYMEHSPLLKHDWQEAKGEQLLRRLVNNLNEVVASGDTRSIVKAMNYLVMLAVLPQKRAEVNLSSSPVFVMELNRSLIERFIQETSGLGEGTWSGIVAMANTFKLELERLDNHATHTSRKS